MKITVIHGSPRKGNSYTATQKFLQAMKEHGEIDVREFFLPKDLPDFCKGCYNCFLRDDLACPHAGYVQPILQAMLEADGLVFNSPVYVLSLSGAMKSFLDHFGFIFLPHRPRPEMFHKKAFILSTTAGAGTRSAMGVIAKSLKDWGVNRVYQRGFSMYSLSWDEMPAKRRQKFENRLQADADRFYKAVAGKKDRPPYLQTRFLYFISKQLLKGSEGNQLDKRYWKEHGWLDGASPFHFDKPAD